MTIETLRAAVALLLEDSRAAVVRYPEGSLRDGCRGEVTAFEMVLEMIDE